MYGARVTDAVQYLNTRGEARTAVRIIRQREPDKFRWRRAVANLSSTAGRLRGRPRMRIEEPVREVVIDLNHRILREECVIDARRYNLDLDRGEVLPIHTVGDLRRYAFLVGADMRIIERYVKVSNDFGAPIDTAACILVGRAMANDHRRRAQRLWLALPDEDAPGAQNLRPHQQIMAQRAAKDAEMARRWAALAKTLVQR